MHFISKCYDRNGSKILFLRFWSICFSSKVHFEVYLTSTNIIYVVIGKLTVQHDAPFMDLHRKQQTDLWIQMRGCFKAYNTYKCIDWCLNSSKTHKQLNTSCISI